MFGSNAVVSTIIWAVIGGGLYSYYVVRHATKRELSPDRAQLPDPSSATALFAEPPNARRVLEATACDQPSVASVAADGGLTTRAFASAADAIELPVVPGRGLSTDRDAVLSHGRASLPPIPAPPSRSQPRWRPRPRQSLPCRSSC